MKAIETRYDGYRFRSRTEARWAVYFNHLGIKYHYEKEGFKLEDGTWYLPDFWLPDLGMWAEVKGGEFTEEEEKKCREVANGTEKIFLMLPGPPDLRTYAGIHPENEYGQGGVWVYEIGGKWLPHALHNVGTHVGDTYITNGSTIPDAVATARSARFGKGGRG
jgi:hypothetical protein